MWQPAAHMRHHNTHMAPSHSPLVRRGPGGAGTQHPSPALNCLNAQPPKLHSMNPRSLEAQARGGMSSSGWDASTLAQRDATAPLDSLFSLGKPTAATPPSPSSPSSSSTSSTSSSSPSSPSAVADGGGGKAGLSQQVQWMHTVGVVGALLALAGLSSLDGNGQVRGFKMCGFWQTLCLCRKPRGHAMLENSTVRCHAGQCCISFDRQC